MGGNCITADDFAAMAREAESRQSWRRAFVLWQAAMDNHEGRHTDQGRRQIREWEVRQADCRQRQARYA